MALVPAKGEVLLVSRTAKPSALAWTSSRCKGATGRG